MRGRGLWQRWSGLFVCMVLGWVWLGSCQSETVWYPPTQRKACAPSLYSQLRNASLWMETFDKTSGGGAMGCLEISWFQGGSVSLRTKLVHISASGILSGWSEETKKIEQPLTFSLAGVPSGATLAFRVLVFGKRGQLHGSVRKQLCLETWRRQRPTCENKESGDCWFAFLFTPRKGSSDGPQVLEGGSCHLSLELQAGEVSAESQTELVEDASSPHEGRSEPPQERTSEFPPACQEGTKRDCYSGPEGTAGRGACKVGKQRCIGGVWSPCIGEVLPKKEACNDVIDDDCDGRIDEGCVSTFAGPRASAYQLDGPADKAWMFMPQALAVDTKGRVYIADTGNHRIRILYRDKNNKWQLRTLAGSGIPGYQDGAPEVARFSYPSGILVNDNGTEVYVSDTGNRVIRKILVSGNQVRVQTFAGGGGTSGLRNPRGLVFNKNGGLYVADSRAHRIFSINAKGVISSFAGGGQGVFGNVQKENAKFDQPAGLATDAAGNLYISEVGSHRIRFLDISKNTVTIIAGAGGCNALLYSATCYVDGTAVNARFFSPYGLVASSQGEVVYIADSLNSRLRRLKRVPGGAAMVDTLAGGPSQAMLPIEEFSDGEGSDAKFYLPMGIAMDKSGHLYIADTFNNRIRRIDANTRDVYTIAGSDVAGHTSSDGESARFMGPGGLALDSQHRLYVADTFGHRLRRISKRSNGRSWVERLDGVGLPLALPNALTWLSGRHFFHTPFALSFVGPTTLLITEYGGHRIQRYDVSNKKAAVVAGSDIGESGIDDKVVGRHARFAGPTGLAIDHASQVMYVAEALSHRIRKIDFRTWKVDTYAGVALKMGMKNGSRTSATFNSPTGVVLGPQGALYVADTGNHVIRKIDGQGNVTTFAGSGTEGFKDGPNVQAQFRFPMGLDFDEHGNLYVADAGNHLIRKIDPTGYVTTYAGDIASGRGVAGFKDDLRQSALFRFPIAVLVDVSGGLYVSDYQNQRIRYIAPD